MLDVGSGEAGGGPWGVGFALHEGRALGLGAWRGPIACGVYCRRRVRGGRGPGRDSPLAAALPGPPPCPAGSGYLTAAMGVMVRPGGRVLGVEKHPELAAQSVANVRACVPELLDGGVIELRSGNVLGAHGAVEEEEPFDAIHVGAGEAGRR